MPGMKYQCPFCESFDVRRSESGEVVCFSCFSICSNYDVDDLLWKRAGELPTPFPESLERRKTKRTSNKSERDSSGSTIMTRMV